MAYPKPTLDGTELLWATTWEEDSEVIENAMISEAGTDLVNVVRYDKLTINASYRCTSDWAKKFKDWSKATSLTLTRYDVSAGTIETRYVRMRDFKTTFIKHSEKVTQSNGLWEVSFTLIEI